jgi:hypothetical protein
MGIHVPVLMLGFAHDATIDRAHALRDADDLGFVRSRWTGLGRTDNR